MSNPRGRDIGAPQVRCVSLHRGARLWSLAEGLEDGGGLASRGLSFEALPLARSGTYCFFIPNMRIKL